MTTLQAGSGSGWGGTVKFRPVLQVLLLTINSAAASMLVAQDAKIRIRVTPPDALISIDGKSCGKGPIREIQTIPGPHVVIVSKYDFTSERREVLLRKGDNPGLEFTLRRRDNTFSAQSGGIQIETESSAAVLVNGDANDYFIDHPPMLNNNLWRTQLVVPAGKYHVTIVSGDGQFWSGDVDVQPNTSVIVQPGSRGRIIVREWLPLGRV